MKETVRSKRDENEESKEMNRTRRGGTGKEEVCETQDEGGVERV